MGGILQPSIQRDHSATNDHDFIADGPFLAMTDAKRSSLQEYARRRFVLSGTSVIKDHYPYCHPTDQLGIAAPANSGGIVSFAHYDYLALGADPRILDAARDAVSRGGVGAGASRLVGGERTMHRELEREFAAHIGVEDTLSMASGYGTNVALIGHLLTKGDLIIADEAAHNSIMAGTQLSRADALMFRHNDLDHLREMLARGRANFNRVLVVIEGLYSMDGDIPDLPGIIALCRSHHAWLMIDEAHSIGVLGKTGRGITEHFGIDPADVDLIVGTLSKAFVTCGGLIGGKRDIIEWLRFTLPGFVYSVGLPPPTVAAARCARKLLQNEPHRLARLRENSRYFLAQARRRNLDVGMAAGIAVIPVLFADVAATVSAGNAALDAGIFVPPIAQIGVPKNAPRLRFFLSAGHTQDQIGYVLDVLSRFSAAHPSAKTASQIETREMTPDIAV